MEAGGQLWAATTLNRVIGIATRYGMDGPGIE
jgi:hypothetical protein